MLANKWLMMGWIGAALLLALVIQQHALIAERHRAATFALGAVNERAMHDTTHAVALENTTVARLLGDTLVMFERQVVQARQERDAMDRALHAERIARYAMESTVRALHRDTVAAVQDVTVGDTRRAVFDVRDPPYDVHAEVEMPPGPDTSRLSVRVRMDPLPLSVRLVCGAADENGIRAASIAAEAPAWATVRFDRVEQSPELCASPALAKRAGGVGHLGFTPLVIGAGRVFGGSGPGVWGLFVGAGVRVMR